MTLGRTILCRMFFCVLELFMHAVLGFVLDQRFSTWGSRKSFQGGREVLENTILIAKNFENLNLSSDRFSVM